MKFDLRLYLFLAVCALVNMPAMAQSTSEAVMKLRTEADTFMASFVQPLKKSAENPKLLLDGDILASAETSKSDLDSLLKKIDEQMDLLSKKEVDISAKSLSEADKADLLTLLANQKKPLQELKARILNFEQKLEQFIQTDAYRLKLTYNSFESISGIDRAREKLKSEIELFLKNLPFLKELEKIDLSTPTKTSLTASLRSTPSPSPSGSIKAQSPQASNLQLGSKMSLGDSFNGNQPKPATTLAPSPPAKPASPNLTPLPTKSEATVSPVPLEPKQSVANGAFFKFPKWFVVPMVLMFIALLISGKMDSDGGVGCFLTGMTLLTIAWGIWLVFLWFVKFVAAAQ